MRVTKTGLVLVLGSMCGCSSPQTDPGFQSPQPVTAGSSGAGSSGASSGSSGGTSGNLLGGSSGGGSSSGGSGPTVTDGGAACNPNPSQYDIPNNNCDDDGDGTVDNVLVCDGSLTASGTAAAFLQSMGVCSTSSDANHWGIVSATYTNGHSQTTAGPGNFNEQHGILSTFGTTVVPREGYAFGVLSSGSATADDSDNGPYFKGIKDGMQGGGGGGLFGGGGGSSGNSGDVPSGFPKPSGSCPVSSTVNDVIDLKVQIRVPTNAQGFTFDFDFWSGEWPDYLCSDYNDSFIAYLQSTAFNGGTANNISFDSNGNTINVNNNFFSTCTAGVQTGCDGNMNGTSACSDGPTALGGTGFDMESPPQAYCGGATSTSGGATSWLTSSAPVAPGEVISLEFLIWDTGDQSYDSSVILDNFAWVPTPPMNTTIVSPPPPPPPPPK